MHFKVLLEVGEREINIENWLYLKSIYIFSFKFYKQGGKPA